MTTLWFIIVVVFWTGFVVLEGFDFGVGVLHGVVGRTDAERSLAVRSIGPFWDGNEVWLVVGGAAIFAAFPQWYATMFSSLYLALVLTLLALMVRGVSFEYRSKVDSARWRGSWRWGLTVSSAVVPLIIGIALGDLVHGLPINQAHVYTGSFWTLLQPYGVFAGVTLLALSVLSGATFLTIRTDGPVAARAATIAPRAGWAFAAACAASGLTVVLLFVNLYPHVMVSTTSPAYSLTAAGTASPPYTLKVMTVVAAVATPVVLAYQAWSFWVFRRRLHGPASTPEEGAGAVAPASRS